MTDTAIPGGTILRNDAGDWFYIRDDLLEQFRVKDQESLDALQRLTSDDLEDEVAGYAMPGTQGFALLPGGPVSFEMGSRLSDIGFGNLAIRANRGLGIGAC